MEAVPPVCMYEGALGEEQDVSPFISAVGVKVSV